MMGASFAPLVPCTVLLLFALSAGTKASADPLARRIVQSLTEELKQQLKTHDIGILLVLPGSKDPKSISIKWDEVAQGLQRVEYIRSFQDFTTHWHKPHSRPGQSAMEHHRGLRSWRALLQHSWHDSSSSSSSGDSTGAWGLRLLQVGLKGPVIASKPAQQQQPKQEAKQQQQAATVPPPTPADLPPLQHQQQQQQQQQAQSKPTQSHQPRVKVAMLTLGTEGALHSGQASLETAIARRLRNAVVMTLAHSTHKDKPETLVAFDAEGTPIAVAVQESSVFRDAFSKIYGEKLWTAAGGGSGPGSSKEYTANVRGHLSDVLTRYNITSMLDSSCGSMHWMPLVLQEHEKKQKDFRFMGTDVVCSLIDQHKVTFVNHTNWQFQCVDYSAQPLPKGYELVWSRDSLQHIPMHGTWQFLNNVKASGAKYLLVGSYVTNRDANVNVPGGGYYSIDLLKPPFNVSKPIEVIDEKVPDGKHLLLFEVAKMTWSDPLDGLVR